MAPVIVQTQKKNPTKGQALEWNVLGSLSCFDPNSGPHPSHELKVTLLKGLGQGRGGRYLTVPSSSGRFLPYLVTAIRPKRNHRQGRSIGSAVHQ